MRFIIGVFLGAVLASSAVYYWLEHKDPIIGKSFTISNVKSHSLRNRDNSETSLSIYRSGDNGHVIGLICQFSPDSGVELAVDGNHKKLIQIYERATGKKEVKFRDIPRVKVGQISMQFMGGQYAYFCEPEY